MTRAENGTNTIVLQQYCSTVVLTPAIIIAALIRTIDYTLRHVAAIVAINSYRV